MRLKQLYALLFVIGFLIVNVVLGTSWDNKNDRIHQLEKRDVVNQQQIIDLTKLAKYQKDENDTLKAVLKYEHSKPKVASRSRTRLPKRTIRTHSVSMGPLNWAALRRCENGGSYTSKSGDHFRGAYQFNQSTWNGVARRHASRWVGVDPASAPAEVQDQFALWLYQERGRQPWPVCGKRL